MKQEFQEIQDFIDDLPEDDVAGNALDVAVDALKSFARLVNIDEFFHFGVEAEEAIQKVLKVIRSSSNVQNK